MLQYKGVEHRQFIRIPFWFVTKYQVYPYEPRLCAQGQGECGAVGAFRQGVGKNMSIGGICFETEDRFDVSTTLKVELDMPALDHGVRVIGQVVWVRSQTQGKRYVYGMAFTKIQPEDVEAVKKIVETFA